MTIKIRGGKRRGRGPTSLEPKWSTWNRNRLPNYCADCLRPKPTILYAGVSNDDVRVLISTANVWDQFSFSDGFAW